MFRLQLHKRLLLCILDNNNNNNNNNSFVKLLHVSTPIIQTCFYTFYKPDDDRVGSKLVEMYRSYLFLE